MADRDDGDFRRLTGLDEAELRQVLQLVAASEIRELEIAYDGGEIVLRRDPDAVSVPAGDVEMPVDAAVGAEEGALAVTSPLVGFFHASVRPGERVGAGQPLGFIETLGVPTSLEAPQPGLVEEMLVSDGEAVEYGEALLVLRRDDR